MDETTTSTAQDENQAAQPQPDVPETQAVQEQDSPNTQPADQPAPAEGDDEAELLEWAEKKGLSTEDPKKLLKIVRESESKMHEATNEASKLRDSVQNVSQDEGQDDVYQLINRLKVTEFYLNKPEARQYDDKMAEILEEKPYLAGDLGTLYDLARFRSADEKLVQERQAGVKEGLQQAKKSEIASPPQASSTTRKQPTDEIPEFTSVAQYEAWKKETGFNPFVAP